MQTSVLNRFALAVEGNLSDDSMTKDALSKVSEEASAEIPFGRMVKAGTDAKDVKLMTATNNKLVGISMFNQCYAKPQELGDLGMKPKMVFNVLNKGRIFVRVEDAVTPASEVHVRAITGGTNGYGASGAESAGAFRGTADSTDTIDISAFAKFMGAAAAGELVELEIDMTNASQALADS